MKVIITRFPLQVSRSTGILSHFVNLNIVIPEAFILGSGEHHVDVGSIINLVCIIEKVRISFFFFFFLIRRFIHSDVIKIPFFNVSTND